MGAIGESICIENSFGIAVELIGGLQFRCAESAVDKKFNPNRNTGRNRRPDNRRTAQRRAIGNIGGDGVGGWWWRGAEAEVVAQASLE